MAKKVYIRKTGAKMVVLPRKKVKKSNNKVIGQIIGLGVVAGMRTSYAPAIISHYLSQHPTTGIKESNLKFMASPVAAYLTKAFAAFETVGDKLPTTPNRTDVPQIFGRIVSGAFAGAVIAQANKVNLFKGILIGGTSALASTFGFFYLRKYIDKLPHVKDVYTGAAEDLLALGTGILLMK